MLKRIVAFFDRLEDRIRSWLSRRPVLYAVFGAIGIVLVWKGIWEITEHVPALHGAGSVLLGFLILLATGLLVSVFVGDEILISGFIREKKTVEKTEHEIREEGSRMTHIEEELDAIQEKLDALNGKT